MTPGLVLTPRRPRGAGGGEEQAGEARCPSPPQTLFAGEVGREGHSITGLAAAGSSGIGRKSRQFLPAQASCRDPGAQTRIVSVARFGWIHWKSMRPFKGIFCEHF